MEYLDNFYNYTSFLDRSLWEKAYDKDSVVYFGLRSEMADFLHNRIANIIIMTNGFLDSEIKYNNNLFLAKEYEINYR